MTLLKNLNFQKKKDYNKIAHIPLPKYITKIKLS